MIGKIVELSKQKPLPECKLAFHSKEHGWHIGYLEDGNNQDDHIYFREQQGELIFNDITHWFFVFDQG